MKNLIQDGTTITHAPTVDVVSGTPVLIGAMIAVALANVPANTPGTFIPEGVFELAKAQADDIGQGDQLYWDDAAKVITTTATDNTPAGKAWAAAGNGALYVEVKINV